MDEEHANDSLYFFPVRTNTMAVPSEQSIQQCYEVYRPSIETRKLTSEIGRTIYAEAFLEDPRLGPLSDMCMRAMARTYNVQQLLPSIKRDPFKMRLYYDSLSVDVPLEECYHITDEKFWRRVALAKSTDKSLSFKKSYDWKSLGLSIKFVELVEACEAEFWPEDEMKPLAMKIKDYVKEMHIRRLQSLSERWFDQFRESEDDEDEDLEDSTDISSLILTPKPSIGIQDEQEPEADAEREEDEQPPEMTEEELQLQQEQDEIRAARIEQKRKLKEEQLKRRAAREERRKRIAAKKPPPPPESTTGKKKRKPRPKGVFDIPIEPPEDDGEDKIDDKRNLARLLHKKKSYKYPPEDCHHIDLSFVRFFDNLVVFTIEFRGPQLQRNFHPRHLNFSYTDIEHLARGVSFLYNLNVFRLRSSLMDARKLHIIVQSLMTLPNLEIVDFGYDYLDDDCGLALYDLFNNSTSIKSLELENNNIGAQSVRSMATALAHYEGKLEYLGLGGNPLGENALHALTTKILGTEHISHLCLTSAQLSKEAIICCVAQEFLQRHPALKHLQIETVPMDRETGNELLKALQNNLTIQYVDCRGCGLDQNMDVDLDVILQRNRYLARNPYIGDATKSKEEIIEFVNRIKNPILLRAIEAVKKRNECRAVRPNEYIPSEISLLTIEDRISTEEEARRSIITERTKAIAPLDVYEQRRVSLEEDVRKEKKQEDEKSPIMPFIYDPNNFTLEEWYKHAYVPGPEERYYYVKQIKLCSMFGVCNKETVK